MAARSGAGDARPGAILLVVHDFIARSSDELGLAKGDRIELIERDDDFGDGWFLGRHLTNGKTGLFPEVYTTQAPKGTLSSRPGRTTGQGKTKPTDTTNADSPSTIQRISEEKSPSPQPASPAAQSSLAQTALRSSLPGTTTSVNNSAPNSDSLVMNETLSVIDEHITDLKSPRSSQINGNKRDTLTSVYSTTPLARSSYIPGHETDEEDQQTYTEDEVMAWNPARVAEYLEDTGVEHVHCTVFKEQEISGEVLLAMDQNSIFLKELDLGSVGRRLKTWHKIKALQDDVRRSPSREAARAASNDGAVDDEAIEPTGRVRSMTMGSALPRALAAGSQHRDDESPVRSNTMNPSQLRHSGVSPTNRDGLGVSPLQSITSMSRPDVTQRLSAQEIRNMNHSRRHSSMASLESFSTEGAGRTGHRKQPSLDQKWQLGQPTNGRTGAHGYTTSVDSKVPHRFSSAAAPGSPDDVDRGYFSSNEVETRTRKRNVLKRGSRASSPAHSRQNSGIFTKRASAHSMSTRDLPASPRVHSGAYSSMTNLTSLRSATSPPLDNKSVKSPKTTVSPLVTRLDPEKSVLLDSVTASPQTTESISANATPSPMAVNRGLLSTAKAKITGLRSVSDGNNEKIVAPISVDRIPATVKEGNTASPTRTGASTPSTENQSLELSKSDLNSRTSTGSGGNLIPPSTSTRRLRARTKKETSAYTRGLEKKTPADQMLNCDYCGWMKKKSGSLMTTWKTRLFILRGRRLSYYYSDDDVEEKGLIDISFHRVLPVQNETLTGLHATVTGAGGLTASPTYNSMPTMAEQDLRNHPPKPGDEDSGLFIFKLVPPKTGLSKAVTFTKPTVHYFAVNSRQEGRLWMAALMKATIDRDEDGVVTTTYNQKTISLAKARARRERPPALREEDPPDAGGIAELGATVNDSSEKGLGIGGLGDTVPAAAPTLAGAEKEEINGLPADVSGRSFLKESISSTSDPRDLLNEKVQPVEAPSG